MKVIRFVKEEFPSFTADDFLNYLSTNPQRIDEVHCDGTLTERHVVDLCKLFLREIARVKLRSLVLAHCQLQTIHCAEWLTNLLQSNTTIKCLDLRHNLFGPEGLQIIIQPLVGSSNQTLESLILKNNKLGHRSASNIAILLRNNRTLRELHVGNNSIGVKGIKVIAPEVHHSLRRLHLGHNQLKARGIRLLVDAFMSSSSPHNLQFLDLTCNQIGAKGMQHLVEWLIDDRALQTLWLCSNDLNSTGAALLASILKFNFTLEEIRLGGNPLLDDGAVELAPGLQENASLRVLELDWNQIGDGGARALAEALQHGATALQRLDLSGNQIALPGSRALASAIPFHVQLQELNITRNQLNCDAGNEFVKALTRQQGTLEKLEWSENPMTESCSEALERALRFRANMRGWLKRELNELQQQDSPNPIMVVNWMSKTCICDHEVVQLASVLCEAQQQLVLKLTGLYLGGQHITGVGIKALSRWMSVSQGCPLERLYLRDTRPGVEGMEALGAVLQPNHNPSLRVLSLTCSHITRSAIDAFLTGLRGNQSLQRLNLAHNKIGDEGLYALGLALQTCRLKSLNASSNKIKGNTNTNNTGVSFSEDGSNMWEALAGCSSLRELHLMDNELTDRASLDLAHALLDDCPFTLVDLSGNPLTKKTKRALKRFLPERTRLHL